MATRSRIAIENQDGSVTSIYCHWDGYIKTNGVILDENYYTKDKVEELIALGDLSSLDETINRTVAYHRDQGDDLIQTPFNNVEELFEANFQERENAVRENTPKEFFQSLPEELQVAAKYVADGGQDLKGLFRTLAQVEEMYELDTSNEYDQAEIARQYLHATQFGTAEEIEAEIQDWHEMGKLKQKADQFKPKLDRMQEEIVARKLAEMQVDQHQLAQLLTHQLRQQHSIE